MTMLSDPLRGERLLTRVRRDFIGLDTAHRVADGRTLRRVYLDSAATTLALGVARAAGTAFLHHNANAHSRIHFGAFAATEALADARRRVLAFVGADPQRYLCLFVGCGATAALNRAAHYLHAFRPQAGAVLVSLMEHHSNDLPHRRVAPVRHVPLHGVPPALAAIDIDAFTTMLRTEPIRYAAVSLASNVTGIVNPVARLCSAAHEQRVPVLVDASQAIAHLPVRIDALGEPDALVFSGHKAYAPGSPGVLVIRRGLVEAAAPAELGGGMVDRVTRHDYEMASELAQREEAGTPNVVGAVTLAAALEVLQRVGMRTIGAAEQRLNETLLDGLAGVPGIRIYGSTDLARCPRVGVASFNLAGLDHGLVAAVLNDHHNIAVRNHCFCAQPCVRALLQPELWALDIGGDRAAAQRDIERRRGMVRASLGLYTTADDIARLLSALRKIARDGKRYRALYRIADDGEYRHTAFAPPPHFDVARTIDELCAG
jgi:cysteine desulfurase / selenocysteine lyase